MDNLDLSSILEKLHKKKIFKRYFLLTIALFISAVSFNLLFLPGGIVAGGASGVSVITEYALGWSPSVVIFVISIIALILSFIFLGVEKTSGTVVATFIYPLFVQLTSPITNYITLTSTDMILVAILGGVTSGLTAGIITKAGFSSGGLNVLCQIIYKKLKISMSKTNAFINAIVVIVGGFVLGFTNVMYALIVIYISSLVMDKVLLGISNNKAFYIVTSDIKSVKDYVINNLNHSVTQLNAKGGFLEEKQDVLMVVVPTRDYFQLTEGIKMIDQKAFFVVVDAYEVSGGA